ncbi:MAG: hypothetical protein WBA16_01950 [Nonlabens sp.]
MLRNFFFTTLLVSTGLLHAQKISDYKYVLVPSQFEFQSSPDQYDLNDLMVFELKKRGINAFKNTDALPLDMNRGLCNTLNVRASKSGMLLTKVSIELVDCSGLSIFQTEGKSKSKNYQKAYFQSVREALEVMGTSDLSYTGKDQQVNTENSLAQELDENRMNPAFSNEESTARKAAVINEVIVLTDLPKTYTSQDGTWTLQRTEDGFSMWQDDKSIGMVLRGQNGCYLVNTNDLTGLGYERKDQFIIEVFVKGNSRLILFDGK